MEVGLCSICSRSQAKLLCSCSLPPLPICESCFFSHFTTVGNHIAVPLRSQVTATSESGNEVCDECGHKPADYFCLCSPPLRKFCRGCDYSHYQKTPHMVHFKHPMTGYQTVASGRVAIEVFKKKQFCINDMLIALEEELNTFDTFVRSAEAEFTALQEKITAKKTEFLKDKQSQRDKLISAIRDASQIIGTKRYVENLEVVTYLDDFIANGYQYSWLRDMRIFTGNIKVQPVVTALECFVECEIGGILMEKAQAIPVFQNNAITLYHQPTFTKTTLALDKDKGIDNGTAFCYIGKYTILCVGGNNSNRVYEINVQSGKITNVSNLSAAKGYVGIWNYQGKHVFTFGGQSPHQMSAYAMNTSEKYTMLTNQLTAMRPMLKQKSNCSVCEHSTSLYISGFNTSEYSIEQFNPLNETYTLILTESPSSASMLCCVEDNLYQITSESIQVASLSNGPASATFTVKQTFSSVGNCKGPRYPLKHFKYE